jgi:hypothetical protein
LNGKVALAWFVAQIGTHQSQTDAAPSLVNEEDELQLLLRRSTYNQTYGGTGTLPRSRDIMFVSDISCKYVFEDR